MFGSNDHLQHPFITCPNTVPIEESLAGEPDCVAVNHSGFNSSKMGVFMVQDLPKNVCFGPLLTEEEEEGGQYSTSSRWMHFILSTSCDEKANLVPVRYKGQLYYKTKKDVKANEELLRCNPISSDMSPASGGINSSDCPTSNYDRKASPSEATCDNGGDSDTAEGLDERTPTNHTSCQPVAANLGIADSENSNEGLPQENPGQASHSAVNELPQENPDRASHSAVKREADFDLRPHHCDLCEEHFRDYRSLRYHRRRHRPNPAKLRASRKDYKSSDEESYACDICGKNFSSRADFQAHKHTDSEKNASFVCKSCGKRFSVLAHLHVHLDSHAPSDGARPFVCDTCGRKFAKLHLLTNHTKKHFAAKSYKCNFCKKAFANIHNLRTHEQIHTGERPFMCSVCGKGFTQLGNLDAHRRVHSGEKPYACTTCGRRFTQLSQLLAHNRTHTGEKPYVCKTCGERFTQLSNLQQHKCIHTGEKPV